MISQLEDMKRPTDNDTLRAKLAQAMGNCCEWPGNRALFGGSGAVAPLVNYLGKIFLVNCLLLLANCMTRIFGCPWHLYTHPFGLRRSFKGVLVFGESGAVIPLVSDQLIRNSNSTCFCMTVKAYATKNPTFYNYFNQLQNSTPEPSFRKRKTSLWFWFTCWTEAKVKKKWVDVCPLSQAGSNWNFILVLWLLK